MENITISSLSDFVSEIIKFYNNSRPDKHLFFRGHSQANWKLLPSVIRDKDKYKERDIYLDFMQYAPEHNIQYDFISQSDRVLADMQHYVTPTRLLDWTVNPLIALYFSCCDVNSTDKDGKVYLFDPWTYNSRINNYSKPKSHEANIYARSLLVYDWKDVEIQKHVREKYLLNYNVSLEKPFAYVSQFTNKRKVHQRGCFLIWGKNERPFEDIVRKIKCKKPILDCFTIKGSCKETILNELNMFYINPYSIYPDYKGMSEMIKSHGGLFNLSTLESSFAIEGSC